MSIRLLNQLALLGANPLVAGSLSNLGWCETAKCIRSFASGSTPMQGHTGVGAGGEGGHDAAAVASVPGNILSIGVWGANTDVGKTLVSAGLARAARRSMVPLLYVKPVQTGQVLDAATVAAAAGQNGRVATWLGAHAAALHGSKGGWSDRGEDGSSGTDGEAAAATLFAWQLAASPHRAVEAEGRPVADAEVVTELAAELSRFSGRCRSRAAGLPDEAGWAAQGLAMVETAGGVASPGPTGTLQCDLLRPFRLPCVLVACAKLGGISATVAAAELLQMRGYDLAAVLVPESSEGNAQFLQRRFGNTVPVHTLPALPGSPGEDAIAARSEPGGAPLDPPLQDWLVRSEPAFGRLLRQLADFHSARQQQLASAAARARSVLWWPFTQHGNISDAGVTVIDSRCGEYFAVAAREPGSEASAVALQPQFDGCASWWTQGLSAELQPEVNLSLAAGAGRYGHVMFPENAHEPALQLAERLLDLVGSGWASRVFFSDNGSTAVEVALKMAFRSFIAATEQGAAEESPPDMLVAALEGSYHGDTLGAMDCSPPSEFNGRRQMPWYSGRGVYLQAPSVGMQGGEWTVADDQLPEGEELQRFTTLDQVFSAARDASPTADAYRARIRARFDEAERSRNARIGACLMEPVLLGAGGMVMLDPLYQRVTVQECRARGIPVIFDEVFAGLWRLGAPSAAQLLGVSPDIACYAKLLTGGTMPLAVTLASERVFQAFDGESKLDALLHGHSYTAHPIGCSVANASLATYSSMRLNPCLASEPQPGQPGTGRLVSLWDSELVQELSRLPRMLRVVALGTVLAAELKPAPGSSSGYSALGAKAVVAQLRRQGVFARPLGNVVYLMVTPTTPPATCRRLLQQLLQALSDAEAASVAADDHVHIP